MPNFSSLAHLKVATLIKSGLLGKPNKEGYLNHGCLVRGGIIIKKWKIFGHFPK